MFDGNHPLRKIQLAGLYYVFLALLQPVTAVLALMLLVMAAIGFVVQNWINLRNFKLAFESAYSQMRTKFFWICIVAVPFILYILITYSSNPFVQLWEEQNIITSPPLIDYLLAYGWAIPFIVFAVMWMVKRKINWQPFLLSWILILPILIYAPVKYSEKTGRGSMGRNCNSGCDCR